MGGKRERKKRGPFEPTQRIENARRGCYTLAVSICAEKKYVRLLFENGYVARVVYVGKLGSRYNKIIRIR